MHKSFDELVPNDTYAFAATTGVAHGDGWFIYLTAYTANPESAHKDIVLIYTSGVSADSTIDSDRYDASMTSPTSMLLIKKTGGKSSKWSWEEGKGNDFRRLTEGAFEKRRREIMKSAKETALPTEKIRSVLHPRRTVLQWHPR